MSLLPRRIASAKQFQVQISCCCRPDPDGTERIGSEFFERVVRGLNGCEPTAASRARKLENPRCKQVAETKHGNVVVEGARSLRVAADEPCYGKRILGRLIGDVERFRTDLRGVRNNARDLGNPAPQCKDDQTVKMGNAGQVLAQGLTGSGNDARILANLDQLPTQITGEEVA